MARKQWIYGIILTTICITISGGVLAGSLAGSGYGTVFKKWTKSARFYEINDMEASLIWHATLLSDDMIGAQKALLEKRKFELKLENPADRVSFFIGLYTSKDLKKFTLESSSVWRIFLVGADGNEIGALKIEPVTVTVTERTFYPYLNRWTKAYRVEFPKTELGKNPKLILRSIVDESALTWRGLH